jgi:hypothetical protein
MACPNCGSETIVALTPAGRVVDLEFDHVFVRPDERWPSGVFILGVSGGGGDAAVAQATPALELNDRKPQRPSGPFRRAHIC